MQRVLVLLLSLGATTALGATLGGHGRVVEIRLAGPSAAPTTPPTIPGVRQPGLSSRSGAAGLGRRC